MPVGRSFPTRAYVRWIYRRNCLLFGLSDNEDKERGMNFTIGITFVVIAAIVMVTVGLYATRNIQK